MHLFYNILIAVGLLIIMFFSVIFIVATARVIKRERTRGNSTEKIKCGERIVAVLTTKKGKEFI